MPDLTRPRPYGTPVWGLGGYSREAGNARGSGDSPNRSDGDDWCHIGGDGDLEGATLSRASLDRVHIDEERGYRRVGGII